MLVALDTAGVRMIGMGPAPSVEELARRGKRVPRAVIGQPNAMGDLDKAVIRRVVKANLLKTCRQCHKEASENFPAAWLSHYEPSWKRAPMVYGLALFYKVLIPFIIGGLVLQILLHLWRVVVNR